MSISGTRRSWRVAALLAGSRTASGAASGARAGGGRLVAAGGAVGVAVGRLSVGGGAARYPATIVRTAYGVPHITARDFGSLGYGYGFALASDDLCTMAQTYVTVEGERSRYFGPDATVAGLAGGQSSNLDSDIYWRSVIGARLIPRLLAVRTGPGAILPQVRQVMAGYAA